MINKTPVVSKPLSGSKPKKFIRYTRYSNPSLSNQINYLFSDNQKTSEKKVSSNRNVQNNMKLKQDQYKKTQSLANLHKYDSLSKAQQAFINKKVQPVVQQKVKTQELINKKIQPAFQQNVKTQELINKKIQTPVLQNKRYQIKSLSQFGSSRLNYRNDNEVKMKQSHGYNIINCYPALL